jgi:hypothetical protein
MQGLFGKELSYARIQENTAYLQYNSYINHKNIYRVKPLYRENLKGTAQFPFDSI